MFIITRDLVQEKNPHLFTKSEVGIHSKDFVKGKAKFEFRVLDEDGDGIYHGLSDVKDDVTAYKPLERQLRYCGMVEVQCKNLGGEWESLH
jgi:hypothetical protein